MDKDTLILELIAKVDLLTKRVEQLEHFEAENADLKRRLSKYKHPKNRTTAPSLLPKTKTAPKEKTCVNKAG